LVHDQVDCLVHVMNLPVGKDKEDVIYLAGELAADNAQHLFQNLRKISRSAQLNSGQVLSVDV
jgi:hypothetical protein